MRSSTLRAKKEMCNKETILPLKLKRRLSGFYEIWIQSNILVVYPIFMVHPYVQQQEIKMTDDKISNLED